MGVRLSGAASSAACSAGLSCRRRPFRNQSTACWALEEVFFCDPRCLGAIARVTQNGCLRHGLRCKSKRVASRSAIVPFLTLLIARGTY